MVTSSNSLVIHDDDLHQGSAKRAQANGLASLDAASHVPAAQLGGAEMTANKDAASGYAGLDVNSLLALAQQRLNFSIVNFTRDTSAVTGTQAVTGAGFRPRLVIFIAAIGAAAGQMALGFDDGTTHDGLSDAYNISANTYQVSATDSITLWQTGAIIYTGHIQSMDADGFTVAWTKVGAKTGTANIYALCIK